MIMMAHHPSAAATPLQPPQVVLYRVEVGRRVEGYRFGVGREGVRTYQDVTGQKSGVDGHATAQRDTGDLRGGEEERGKRQGWGGGQQAGGVGGWGEGMGAGVGLAGRLEEGGG